MSGSTVAPKLRQHVPTATTGVYWSERRKGGRVWEIRFTDPATGKRRYEVVGNRREQALARLAEIGVKKSRGERLADPTITVGDLVAGWHEYRQVKPRTAVEWDRLVDSRVLPRWRNVRVRDVHKTEIATWLRGLERKDGRGGSLSDGSRALVLAVMSSLMDYAVEKDRIAVNPCRAIGRKHRPSQGKLPARILGDGELDRLLVACDGFPWLKDTIMVTYLAALRLGEACALQWDDVDLEQRKITIARQLGQDGKIGTPKGGKAAEVDMHPELRKLLIEKKLAAGAVNADTPVLPNGCGEMRHPKNVQRAFVSARKKAGLSEEPRALRFHDLRHSMITRYANTPSVVLTDVQAFARQATLQTTLVYVLG